MITADWFVIPDAFTNDITGGIESLTVMFLTTDETEPSESVTVKLTLYIPEDEYE